MQPLMSQQWWLCWEGLARGTATGSDPGIDQEASADLRRLCLVGSHMPGEITGAVCEGKHDCDSSSQETEVPGSVAPTSSRNAFLDTLFSSEIVEPDTHYPLSDTDPSHPLCL